MGRYWGRVLKQVAANTFGFLGWKRNTFVAVLLCLVGLAVRSVVAGFDALLKDALDTIAYTVAPAGIMAMGAIIWNLLRVPYMIDKQFREKLEPLNYDQNVADHLQTCIDNGYLLVGQVGSRPTGDRLEREFQEWCAEVSGVLEGRMPHSELVAFQTITPADFSQGDYVIAARVSKLRNILLRYTANAPPRKAQADKAVISSGDQS